MSSKIFINSKLKDRDIIRHDYVTKTLINLIDNLKLNENQKWITYNDYMEIHKGVIIKYSNELNEKEVNNLINDMNINEDNL